MAFRVVFIENDVYMHVKLNNLVVTKEEHDLWIPLDDISMVVVDNYKISFTVRLMSILAENNIEVVFCDHEHHPIGIFTGYATHSRAVKILKFQVDYPPEMYGSLWKRIVEQKINNQREVLDRLGFPIEISSQLLEYQQEVIDYDSTNREAHAAKVYFNTLMGATFSRGNSDILLNSGLDYGYAIFRAYLARLCVGYGLNTLLGIHHRNEYNAFNLVDDLIEVFRPIIDFECYHLLKNEEYFKPEHRRYLVNLLNSKMKYKGKKMYVSNVMEEYVSSMAAFISGKRTEIDFPHFKDYEGVGDEL